MKESDNNKIKRKAGLNSVAEFLGGAFKIRKKNKEVNH
jgi:hypothetical protein